MSKNLRGLLERKGLKANLLGELKTASSSASDERDNLLIRLSDDYLVGKSSVLGTSSFYDFLKSEHYGKKVFICDGSACLTSGKQEKLKLALLEIFSEEQIGVVTCLGKCHTNSAFMYDHATYAPVDLNSLPEFFKSGSQSISSFNTGTNADKPALFVNINDPEEYYRLLGKEEGNISAALKEIELSGLRGRGGAGFPVHIKLKMAASAVSSHKYIVCNADEGDPGSYSDKWLLEERPHSVLFGMLMTGLITGAETGIFYIRGEYPESVTSVKDAISQFEKLKVSGKIPGKAINFTFHIIEGAGAYICGEETSLLNSIEGLRPAVRTRPPFPVQYGLFGKPTVLCNVETFANIRYILTEGGAAYSALGTEKSAGTKLVSLDGAFRKPGIYEVRMGTPLRIVLDEMGGGTKYPVKAFQIGGPLGGIIPVSKVDDLNLDFESFSEAGFLLGHSGVVSIPSDFPMMKFLLHLFEFTSKESCGKCFPCRLGSDRGSELLKRAFLKEGKIDRELFNDLLETMQLGSLCALGGGLSLPVQNALQYFKNELEEYFC
jgi:NADH:ubiquinone oxidoreductase subunit F (NADH-binding)/NADH:ubiquinone oxidoreductase subunit E